MLLTIKKQIEETIEVKSPANYKDWLGQFHFINEASQLIIVRRNMINVWGLEDGKVHTEAIEELSRRGEPCTKEEFDNAYSAIIAKLDIAAGAVEF